MRTTVLLAALGLVGGCKGRSSCGLSLSDGKEDPDRDIVVLGDRYDGPAFSELGDLEVQDDIVWFCSSAIGLNAYDAENPERLKKLDDLAFSDGDLVYPRCHHLALTPDGQRAYVSQRANSISDASFLATVDTSEPKRLVELSSQTRIENVEGLTVHGDHVLVAAHEAGLLVLERRDDTLVDVGQLSAGLTNPWQVRSVGDLAYVADGEGGLAVVDLAVPSAPVLRGTLALEGTSKDLEVDGDRVYVATGSAGVAVVDVSDPDAPLLLEEEDTPGSALALALGRDAVFVADWNDVRVFDRSDPDDLRARGHEPLTLQAGLDSRTLGIAADGDWLFSGNWTELVSYQHFPEREAPDLTAAPGLLQLGEVPAGSSDTVLLEVSNAGTEPLTLEDADTSSRRLSVANLPGGALAPGARHTLQVTLEPKHDRPWDGWVNLLSDDPDQPRKCVTVEANLGGTSLGDAVDPDTSFVTLDGETIRLGDHEGKAVLLAYFATF